MSYLNRVLEAIKTIEEGDILAMDKDTANYLVTEGATCKRSFATNVFFIWHKTLSPLAFLMVPDCGAFIIRANPTRWEFIQ